MIVSKAPFRTETVVSLVPCSFAQITASLDTYPAYRNTAHEETRKEEPKPRCLCAHIFGGYYNSFTKHSGS